ncbi:MAG: 16S rRNA (adenine(1518)-N(6)/adenine(1519)-N(6))-dimethyltransferase RsmA [Clostridia bacterium]|nr:16S rRNA (adenine(1518)-N(6)/adenine(1519)-N(6))-dimethyltransferase RsmA [Clostridia bacterium]
MDLCSRGEVKRLLDKYGLAPKKAFGQNFLVNPGIPQMIAENSYSFAALKGRNVPHGVLEIGPGVGALTCRLAELYDKVVAVEIDRGLIPLLGESLAEYDNIEIVEGDVMEVDVPSFIGEKFGDILAAGGTVSVCANLPYYITSPVIMRLLEAYPLSEKVPFEAITVMIQLEVADRFASEAGDSDYGAVTASIALRADVRKLFNVSAGNFHPAPKVSSAVIGIVPHGGLTTVYPEVKDSDHTAEEIGSEALKLISLAFGQRRKTFVNAASSAYSKEALTTALDKAGLRADVRGEKLSPRDFCRLADLLL